MGSAGGLGASGQAGQVLAPLLALIAAAVAGVSSAARGGGGCVFPCILQTFFYQLLGWRTTYPLVVAARPTDCVCLLPVGALEAPRDDGDAACARGRSRPRLPAARLSGWSGGGGSGG